MSRYPWRDTSTDIAGGQPPQWETPQGAQVKADEALKESKDYTDEQNVNFNAHIEDTTIHVTPADKANWNSKAPGVHTHANATPTVPGFMSAEDKAKLSGVEAEANKYVHPATHPPAIIAQDMGNRFVSDAEKAAWNGKAEPTEATTTVKGLMSPTDKQKLNGIQAAAEVNQNAFSGVNGVVATSKSDTLQLTGGTGITITEDAATKRLTVTATGVATPGAHASSHLPGGTDVIPDAVTGGLSGLMSGADAKFVRQDGETKTGAQAKADAAEQAANEYTDQKVGEIVIDDASLTQKGIVQLSDAADSPATDKAATPSAVKSVNDGIVAHTAGTSVHGAVSAATASRLIIRDTAGRAQVAAPSAAADIARLDTVTGQVGVLSGLQTTAKTNAVAAINEVFQSGVSAKQGVVDAINAMGGSASTSDSWSTLATKIKAINTGKKYATGLITSPTAAIQFPNFNDINYGAYPLLVTGLTFRPTVVVITRQALGTRDVSTYTFAFNNGSPNESGTTFNYCSVLNTAQGNILEFLKINEYTGTGSNARGYMNDTSFRLPVTVAGVSYRWEAFG